MKFIYPIACIFARLLGLLPLRVLTFIGYVLGVLFWWLSQRERRVAMVNITLCYPELSPHQVRQRARKSIINTAICMVESLWVWAHKYSAIEKKIRHIENQHLMDDAVDAGKGVVLVLAHFGNWELFPSYVGHHYKNGVSLVRNTDIKSVDKLLNEGRGRSGGTIAPCTREGLGEMYRLISQGGVAAVGADQEPDMKHGVFVSFFNHSALTSVLTQDILQKTNAKAIGSTFVRLPKGQGFALKFFDIEPDIYSPDLQKSTAALTKAHEQIIAYEPYQYNWGYKRFNRLPDKTKRTYKLDKSFNEQRDLSLWVSN